MSNRTVRCTERFFDRLELLLTEDRSADGEPSVTDFIVFEVPPIRDRLATGYDEHTLPTDDPEVRVHIGVGTLFPFIAVYATIDAVGSIDVFWLTLHRDG